MGDQPGDGFAIIARRLGGRLQRHWTLHGGVSANVVALELALPDGAVRQVVVRQHGATDWKPGESNVTANEYALLHGLADAGLPVPRPLMVDVSGEVLPRGFLVLPFVAHEPEGPSVALQVERMAGFLSRLHALEAASLDIASALPRRVDPVAGVLEYLPEGFDAARRLLSSGRALPALPEPQVLLHGDFWPGNILWRDQRIAAVIDWEDAAIGDPLADVAGCRVELLWHAGEDARNAFTGHYRRASGQVLDQARLAAWELYVASSGLAYMDRWGLEEAIETRMRQRTQQCLESAIRRLLDVS